MNILRIQTIAALFLLVLLGCEQSDTGLEPRDAAFGGISGVVTNEGGEKLAGVTITAGDFTATTNPDGNYRIADIPPGTRSITARLNGYASDSSTVSVADAVDTKHDIQLHASYSAAPAEALVSYWPMEKNDISGPLLQPAFKGVSGTMAGDIATGNGQVGEALEFDGDDDYIVLQDSFNTIPESNTTFTLTMWIKNGSGYVFGKIFDGSRATVTIYTQYSFEIANNLPAFYFHGAATFGLYAGDTPFSADQWNFIAIGVDGDPNSRNAAAGNRIDMYVNGVKSKVDLIPLLISFPFEIGAAYTTLGSRATKTGEPCCAQTRFSGAIDEVTVWSGLLSPEQIEEIRQYGLKGYALF